MKNYEKPEIQVMTFENSDSITAITQSSTANKLSLKSGNISDFGTLK